MGIQFRDRKNKQMIDASFILKSGNEMSNATQHWHVGDSVSICFDAQTDKIQAIRENFSDAYISDEGFIGVQCVVVKRYHSAVWNGIGVFNHLQDSNVTLEAESGMWEDVLLWIMKDMCPEWAK